MLTAGFKQGCTLPNFLEFYDKEVLGTGVTLYYSLKSICQRQTGTHGAVNC